MDWEEGGRLAAGRRGGITRTCVCYLVVGQN
jgi:hypothetical protein